MSRREDREFIDDALVAFRDISWPQSECLTSPMKPETFVGKAKNASLGGWHTVYIALC